MDMKDYDQVGSLLANLKALDSRIKKTAEAPPLTINGDEIPDDLRESMVQACLPVVQQYFATQRQQLINQLAALGVTVS